MRKQQRLLIAGASGKLGRQAAEVALESCSPRQLVLVTRTPEALARVQDDVARRSPLLASGAPMALVMAMVFAPCDFANRNALTVSAELPEWEKATATAPWGRCPNTPL